MDRGTVFDKYYETSRTKYGKEKVMKPYEVPKMKVISSGIPSLDIITGVGGFPRGTLTEIWGRPSLGKSALTYYTIQEVHRAGGRANFINLESEMSSQIEWMQRLCPDINEEWLIINNSHPGQESVNLLGENVASGAFDVVIFDAIGAMATDNELKPGESKQAFGQAAMVTQMAKQALLHGSQNQCAVILLNHIRDGMAGQYVIEKAPGGNAKELLATLRIHLKAAGGTGSKIEGEYEGEKIQVMQRITAKIAKNKVGVPRRSTGWNFWNVESPEGVIGIDVIQDIIDVSLQRGFIERGGSIYKHEAFPEGKIKGKDETKEWLREHRDVVESLRREMVMQSFNDNSQVRETLIDE